MEAIIMFSVLTPISLTPISPGQSVTYVPGSNQALGVTVEELLGESRPKRVLSPGGKMRQLFEAASKLPRSQQEKVLALLEPFVAQHANGVNGRNGH